MLFELLIVDDEPPIRKGLAHLIKWEALDCNIKASACNGSEAIEIIRASNIDMVITDIKMPEVDGIELSKFIHENYPHIPVIILTGFADFEFARSAIQYNVVDFVLKPTSKQKLMDAVKKAQEIIVLSQQTTTLAKDDLTFLREKLLLETTDMPLITPHMLERLANQGIVLERYFLAAFQPVGHTLGELSGDLSSLKHAITSQSDMVYCYRYNNVILTIYPVEEYDKSIPSWILESCEEIADMADSLYSQKLSIGISLLHSDVCQLNVASSEAINALSMNFYTGQTISICSEGKHNHSYGFHTEFTLLLYNLETDLLEWRFSEVLNEVTSLFTKCKKDFVNAMDVRNLCVHIYYICARVLIKEGASPLPLTLIADIHEAATLSRLEKILRELIQICRESLTNSGKKLSPITEKAICYIRQNLKENLSLEAVAAYVHVNPSHLSRTFKKDCDKTITEYITRMRIEKAQELLSFADTLSYEVAMEIGFRDPAYFSSIFKKYTGMSPTEYKQMHSRGKNS